MIEMHGGRLWVESVEGKGSDFIFTLPLALPRHKSRRKCLPSELYFHSVRRLARAALRQVR